MAGRDLSVALRSLLRRPGLSFGVVLTVALGIGATKHFKFPIDIYNLNRAQPTDKNRYFRVCTVTPPR